MDEFRARITGRGYYCSALAGESDYSLTVNSDLTVSCNCQDYDGTGHIGDLRTGSFEEIYFGPWRSGFATAGEGENPDSNLCALL